MSKPFQANLEAKETSETVTLDIVRRQGEFTKPEHVNSI